MTHYSHWLDNTCQVSARQWPKFVALPMWPNVLFYDCIEDGLNNQTVPVSTKTHLLSEQAAKLTNRHDRELALRRGTLCSEILVARTTIMKVLSLLCVRWAVSPSPRRFFSSDLFLSYFLLLYSGTWSSYLADLLSRRLVGAVGGRNYMKRSYSQWKPAVIGIQTHVLTTVSSVLYHLYSLCSITYLTFHPPFFPSSHLHTCLRHVHSCYNQKAWCWSQEVVTSSAVNNLLKLY